ncbi:alpha/beta hydrolase [Rhodococcus sp. IEGM 1381]|uniref:alpha/beta fold hydrolase n=1 Tax=Rhodococcus sp. IEGM 1381 TaxID=3047085 RepID=UPI0024B67CEA|nr:alpha/beta hydrolase [Rhodococcus sp. IEGM 1381]MDI9896463.1 alpha/beta hydrolase [Rhodococcus sp. IEGM 1381]
MTNQVTPLLSAPQATSAALSVGGHTIGYDVAGEGPSVLLLHGFPQTRRAWRAVLPALAADHHVIAADLPGYGTSERLGEGADGFVKRKVANHLVDFMAELGHDRFAVVGHDRGALIAFRAAMDHPDTITHLGVLDIIPTIDNWAALAGPGGVFAFHLYLLAQPTDLPERMIGADPDTFFGHFLDHWTTVADSIPQDTREHYLAHTRSSDAIHAICDDYRASAFLDTADDLADQQAGRRLTMPAYAAWQDPGDIQLPFDPATIWAAWATDLDTDVISCGHFLPEEASDAVTNGIRRLLAR